MGLKIAILAVFGALIISLGSGLFFLLKDQGESKRTLHSLGVRVTLAILLMALISYGVITGQLQSKAPWATFAVPDQGVNSGSTEVQPESGSDNVDEQEQPNPDDIDKVPVPR